MATSSKSKAGDKPVKATAAAPKAAAKTATKAAPRAATKTASKPAAAKKAAAPVSATAKATKAAKPVTAAKKPAKAAAPASVANAEQRRCYIEVAAYHIAERRGFQGGSPADDWLQAEAEIERLLREGVLKP
jgi:hypothetical protein